MTLLISKGSQGPSEICDFNQIDYHTMTLLISKGGQGPSERCDFNPIVQYKKCCTTKYVMNLIYHISVMLSYFPQNIPLSLDL